MLYLVIDPCFVKGDIPPVSQIYLPEDGTWYLVGADANFMPLEITSVMAMLFPLVTILRLLTAGKVKACS